METKRINWIDISRGIGIILVIMGHSPIQTNLKTIIFSFHMPLFFFLSGYVFKSDRNEKLMNFLIVKVNRLLIPYFAFSSLLLLYNIFYERNINTFNFTIKEAFIGIFYSTAYKMKIGIPLWFLTCLFLVEIIYFFIVQKTDNNRNHIIILIMFALMGILYNVYVNVRLPWSIDTALIGMVFFGIGYLLNKNLNKLSYALKVPIKYLIILNLIFNLVFSYLNSQTNQIGRIDMFTNQYGNYTYFYLAGLSGTFFIVLISKVIGNLKFLQFIGRNTITILALHITIISILNIVFNKIVEKLHFSVGINNTVEWCLIYTITTITILVPIILFVNKFLPILNGKK